MSGLNPSDLLTLVVRPVVTLFAQKFGLRRPSRDAPFETTDVLERLVMGTAAQESGFSYLRQINGPAVGLWQIEMATFNDLAQNYVRYNPDIRGMLESLRTGWADSHIKADEMIAGNLHFACAVTLAQYRRFWRTAYNDTQTVRGLAHIYKVYWNTPSGKATEEQFIHNYTAQLGGVFKDGDAFPIEAPK